MNMYWLRGPYKWEFYAGIFLLISLFFVLIRLNVHNKWIRRASIILPLLIGYWAYNKLTDSTDGTLLIPLIAIAICLIGFFSNTQLRLRRYFNGVFVCLFTISIFDTVNTYNMLQSMIVVQQAMEYGHSHQHLLDEDKEFEALHYAFIVEYDTVILDTNFYTGPVSTGFKKRALLKRTPHINGDDVDLCWIDKYLRLRMQPFDLYREVRYAYASYNYFGRYVDKYDLYRLERSKYHWRVRETGEILPIE